MKMNKEVQMINEIAISKTQMIDRFEIQSEIYLECITKIIYFGDVSASWKQLIWNVVTNTIGYMLKETHKAPTTEFINKWLMEASFGVPYLETPILTIKDAMEGILPNILANTKYTLPQPRIVNYPYAAENVKKFNDAIVQHIQENEANYEKVMQLINAYLTIKQSPYID